MGISHCPLPQGYNALLHNLYLTYQAFKGKLVMAVKTIGYYLCGTVGVSNSTGVRQHD